MRRASPIATMLAARLAALTCAIHATHAQDRQTAPTLRAGTTLVEIAVIALDDCGRPIVDLRIDEISLTEDGQPPEVAFFRFEGREDRERREVEQLPAGLFSNRAEDVPGAPRHVTAIVIDAIHTRPQQQSTALTQVVQYLDALPSSTHVAVYQVGWRLSIVHDFTEDFASLRAHLLAKRARTDQSLPARGDDTVSVSGMSPDAAATLRTVLADMKRQEDQYTDRISERGGGASRSRER